MNENPAWSDEDLSAEEVRQLRRRQLLRRLLVVGLPTLLALALVTALAVPRVKSWRAGQFAERAQALLLEGQLADAYNNASSAMQLRPDLPAARRAYASVLLAAGRGDSLAVWQQMIDDGLATPDDRRQMAEAALALGQPAIAEREAFFLLQEGTDTPEALYIVARVRLAQQRVPDALQALRESLEAGGGDEPTLLMARLQMAANTVESVSMAMDLLRPMGRRDDAAGLEALLVLVTSPALLTAEGRGWIQGLRAHPLCNQEHQLIASSAEIRLDPTSYARVVAETVARYRGGSVDEQAQLARWLNQNREYDTVLEVIAADEAQLRSDLFLIRLDAMAGRGDWAGIASLLRQENLPLQAPVILLYRGRAARETGEDEASASYYRRAVIEAARTPDVMWYVINYLQRVGEDRVLEQELLRLTENPATAREAFTALVPIVQKRQDAAELHRLYQQMLQRLPADPVVQNDARYFAALTGQRPDVQGARELVDRQPQMLAYRITLALTLLKSNQAAEALRVFDGITLDPAQIQPYQRAVLAAVLGANRREEEARQLALSVPQDVVTMQELALIAPWQTGP